MKPIKKLLRLTILVSILVTPAVSAQFAGGLGTEEDPWQVATAEQLDSVRHHLDGHFIQTANIDLDVSPYNTGDGWDPIGYFSTSFSGSFNGSIYTIDGLYFDTSLSGYALFGIINSAVLDSIYLTNVSVEGDSRIGGLVGDAFSSSYIRNSYVTGSVTSKNSSDVGGLVGICTNSYIVNSYSTANVHGSSSRVGGLVGRALASEVRNSFATGTVSGTDFVGGLIGVAEASDVINSYATGSVTSVQATGGLVGLLNRTDISNSHASGLVTNTEKWAGGLVGYFFDDSDIERSYASGNVEGVNQVGGFIGRLSASHDIFNNYATGNVSGSTDVGGFIGLLSTSGDIIDNYATGTITGTTNVGGFIGKNSNGSTIITSYWNITESGIDSSDGGTGLTRAEFLDPDSFSGFNFSTIWDSVHSPEASSPYLQGNIQNPAPNYVLSTSGNGSSGNPYQISTYNQLQNIGDSLSSHFILINDIDASESATANSGEGFDPIGSSANPFTGGFNGDGYTISDLTINRPTEDDIGFFGDLHGSVSNLNLLNVNITGDDNVGGLAGLADSGSDVSESSVSGSITGDLDVGGLAGETRGSVQTSYTHAFVTGGSDVGGLIGFASSNSDFSNSYSMGKVTGSDDVGGFIGEFNGDEISTSYSTSKVTGSLGTGGFIGRDRENWNTLQYIYWNLETSGQSNGNDSESAGLTTIQMMISGSFSNFDFTNIWDINEDHGFPYLRDVGAHRTNIMEITGSEGWRIMSSPMEGISYDSLLKDLWTQGFTGADNEGGASNVYTWNEATQSYESISDASDVPAAGQGFAVYVFDDQDNDETAEGFPKTLMIEGNQMEGTATPTLSYTDTGNSGSDGWNLVGNPYAFPLNWAAGSGWTQTNVDASFYVWNAASGEYQSHNGLTGTLPDSIIAPGQGFWVKANAADPALSLTHDVRGEGGVLLKKAPVPQIKLQLEGGELSSKASVMFSEFAELGKDRYDAFKLAPLTATYLSLGTLLDTLASMDIQALPLEFDLIELELDIKGSDLGGDFSLSWEHLAIPEHWEVTLTDRKTNEEIDMSQQAAYEFVMDSVASKVRTPEKSLVPVKPIQVLTKRKSEEPRLMISISSVSSVSTEPDPELPTSVELQQNYPNPFNPSTTIAYGVPETGEVTLQVFDILGRKVATLLNGERKPAGRYTINFDASNLASGMYIYRLRAGNTVITKKLTLIK